MTFDLAVLVSVGRHPVSGRARRADGDARAVELALNLHERSGARLHIVHAGDPDERALRDYLGMGITQLTVLDLPPDTDPLPGLVAWLRELQPSLLLTGMRAERGPGGGQIPYSIAEALERPIVTGIVAIEPGVECAELRQALPRGRRRALRIALPAVIGVAPVAAAPRASAFARARRGSIMRRAIPDELQIPSPLWPRHPARLRAPRLQVTGTGGAGDRLRAIRETAGHQGRVLENLSADEAARAIHADLVEAGVLKNR